MKIAITSQGEDLQSQVDNRFGRARTFIIYDIDSGEFQAVSNEQNLNAMQGAGVQSAQNVVNTGVEAVITGNCGPKAFSILEQADVTIYTGPKGSVQQAIDDFKAGKLSKADNANVNSHWV